MKNNEFRQWMGAVEGLTSKECRDLAESKIAEQFLIAWHVFETRVFACECTPKKFISTSTQMSSSFDPKLKPIVLHFYKRYQDNRKLKNLMHTQLKDAIAPILATSFNDLSPAKMLHLVLLVVHRYRNNMFHGNKGLSSWLNYKVEIEKCIRAMQMIVTMKLSVMKKP